MPDVRRVLQAVLLAALLITLLLLPLPARAGGSFLRDQELMAVLDTAPEVRDWLLESLDMAESGWAMRVGNDANPNLGGTRVGPYCLPAKPKGAEGDWSLELCVHTDIFWLDAEGRETDMDQAVEARETFEHLEIRPLP